MLTTSFGINNVTMDDLFTFDHEPRQTACNCGERGRPPVLEISTSLWHCTHSAGCAKGLRAAAYMVASLSCRPEDNHTLAWLLVMPG
jgi:hypothetical protein